MAARRNTTGGVEAPRLDRAPAATSPAGVIDADSLAHGDAELLGSHGSHDGMLFDDADLSDYDLEGSSFTECVLRGLTLTSSRLRAARFVESDLVEPFAPTFDAARSTWRDVRIERPRWGSAELFDSEWRSVHVTGGKIDYLNLRSSQLTDVVFEGVQIGELDLGGVAAARVAFIDCRLGTLDLTGANLSSVDVRSTTFDRIDGLAGLEGLVIDDSQLMYLAPQLAAHLGIVVA